MCFGAVASFTIKIDNLKSENDPKKEDGRIMKITSAMLTTKKIENDPTEE